MRPKSMLLLGLALGCGLVASIGISQVIERRNAAQSPPGETEPIIVAMADINPGDLLTPQLIKVEEWPKGKVPQGALTKLEDVKDKRCKIKLFSGVPILTGNLMGENDTSLASTQIPPGYRVVTVSVDSVSSTSSLIQPGDRVDILVYVNKHANPAVPETAAKTILQDVKVFAVNEAFVGKADHDGEVISAKTVSLLVTPQQSEMVTLASEMGKIRLVMRSPGDTDAVQPEGATASGLLGLSSKGDREAEVTAANDQPKPTGGLLAFLNSNKPVEAPIDMRPDILHRMVVIEGDQIREIEFTADGRLPAAAGSSASSALPAAKDKVDLTENTSSPSEPSDEEKKPTALDDK